MIVKSKTWKYAGFSKLANYLTKHRGEEEHYDLEIFHNLHPAEDIHDIAAQFRDNDSYRKQRKGGVAIYHEIMSFHGEDRENLTPEIIEDLTQKYLNLRAPDALAFATVHQDRDHTHVHIMLGANLFRSPRATRISKKEFAEIQSQLEAYQNDTYQLKYSTAYASYREEKRKRNSQSKKQVTGLVKGAYDQARDSREFHQLLEAQGLPVYTYRDKPNGVLVNGNKVRFRQFGLDLSIFEDVDRRMEQLNALREQQLERETPAFEFEKYLRQIDPDCQMWEFEGLVPERGEDDSLKDHPHRHVILQRWRLQRLVRIAYETDTEKLFTDAITKAGLETYSVGSDVAGVIYEGVRHSFSFLGFGLSKFRQGLKSRKIEEYKRRQSEREQREWEALSEEEKQSRLQMLASLDQLRIQREEADRALSRG